jgi:hypothetical protein
MTEVVGWLQIVASPALTGLVIGFLIYLYTPDTLGMLLGIAVASIGFIVGVIWATKVWKRSGTVHFMSRVMATPELDKKDEG